MPELDPLAELLGAALLGMLDDEPAGGLIGAALCAETATPPKATKPNAATPNMAFLSKFFKVLPPGVATGWIAASPDEYAPTSHELPASRVRDQRQRRSRRAVFLGVPAFFCLQSGCGSRFRPSPRPFA
jgi:hypothetical protein